MNRFKNLSLFTLSLILGLFMLTNLKNFDVQAEDSSQFSVVATSEKEGYEAAKAIDKDLNTFWEAADLDPQSLTIDLQKVFQVTTVSQTFNVEDVWSFKIDASLDGEAWVIILLVKED
jgi:hypothetical protein